MKRVTPFTAFALFSLALLGCAHAAGRPSFAVPTSGGDIEVEGLVGDGPAPRPAVVVLSGSKGFGASDYDEIGKALNEAGLDAFLVHTLSRADLDAIATAGTAQARIGYYATRLSSWIASVHAVVAYLDAQPRHAGKIGMLGISLGAQIASAASVDRNDIGALVLVDGGFPDHYGKPIRSLPPLRLIWGGADRIFPLSVGQKLLGIARRLHGVASLDVYERGAHDFFLRSGTPQAASARQSAASFLAARLR